MDTYLLTKIRQQSDLLVARTQLTHQRFLIHTITWSWRCIGIKGPRGTGKTTLLLQRLKQSSKAAQSLYISLDDLHFQRFSLRDTVEAFRLIGVTDFYIDEVHKYAGWSQEIKNLYDFYPDISLIFTGSSLIELHRQSVDLSRRAVMYDLPGLSFREYLSFAQIFEHPAIPLTTLLSEHRTLATEIVQSIRPLAHFSHYLQVGYYPFFLEDASLTATRIRQIVQLILHLDLPTADGAPAAQTMKIGRLLQLLADTTPFKPNFANLSRALGLDRDTIVRYLHHLERAQLIALVFTESQTLSGLQRPEKVYLDNPNLAHALSSHQPDSGSIRETFFQNQLRTQHSVAYPESGDFLIDDLYTFEIGGSGKTKRQIAHLPNGYLALDGLESGLDRNVPLWLFGFLY
jgi:uncharacterized protein